MKPTSPYLSHLFLRQAWCSLLLAALAIFGMGGVMLTPPASSGLLQRIGSWPAQARGPARDVALAGHFAYVAIGEGGLLVLDVADPAKPVRVGGYVPAGLTEFVQVVGSKVYLGTQVHRGGGCQSADRRGQLVILDVSDPTQPVPLGTYMSSTEIQSFLVIDDRVYLGNIGPEQQEFRIVDVHDPARPVLQAGTPDFTARALTTSGGWVYFGVFSELRALNGNELNLTKASQAIDSTFGRIRAVQAVGDRLYAVGGDIGSSGGLNVYDTRTPARPTLLGQLKLSDTPMGITTAGDYLCLGMLKTGLAMVDVRNPSKPVVAATCQTPGVPVRVTTSGQKVFVAGFHGGLHVFDVQEPSQPVRIATVDTGLTARRAVVTGNRAYLLSADSFYTYAAESSDDNPGRSQLEILDITDPTHPTWLGAYDTASARTSLALAGNLAFMVSPDTDLVVLDCQDPAHPVELSKTALSVYSDPSTSRAVQVENPYLYMTSFGGKGLLIYDATDPAKPAQIGELDGDASALQIQGARAYLHAGYQLTVADVTDPRHPKSLGSLGLTSANGATALSLGDHFLCAGQGWYGFSVVDVRDPARLALLGSYDTIGEVQDLLMHDSHTYVAEGWQGLQVFDLSQPFQPVPIAQTPTLGQARGVQIAGSFAYAVEGGRGLGVFTLPTSPVTLLEHPCDTKAPCGGSATLHVGAFGSGSLSYQWYVGETGDITHPVSSGTNTSLSTVVLTEPSAYWVRVRSRSGTADSRTAWVRSLPPVSLDLLGLWPGWRRGPVADVAVFGDLAALAVGNAGLWICDLSDPTAPKVLARQLTKAYASGVAVAGDRAYVVAGGLMVFDISKPSQPRQISELPAYGSRVVLSGGYAYISGGALSIVDVSNPASPQLAGSFQADRNSFSANVLAVSGPYACIADSAYDSVQNVPTGHLLVLDVSNPAVPKQLASFEVLGGISAVGLLNNYAYVVSSSYNRPNATTPSPAVLQILDLSNPAQPSRTGTVRFTQNDSPNRVCVRETLAYVADYQAGLSVFDITSPSQPKRLNNLTMGLYGMNSLCLSGTRAYAGLGDAGFVILDISQASSPKRLGRLETGGFAEQVAVSANTVFLAEGTLGLRVLEVSDPAAPQQTALCQESGSAMCAAVIGPTVYFGGDSLTALDMTDPSHPKSIPNSPMVTHLTTSGQYLYTVDSRQVRILDVANPTSPTVVATRDLYGFGENKSVVTTPAGYALVGREWEGLQVLDVSTPTTPKPVGAYCADSPVWDVAVRDRIALVTLGPELPGLDVLDLENIVQPTRLTRINLPLANSVAWSGPYACVTGQELNLFDMTDPANPVRVASHTLGAELRGLQAAGNRIYVAAGDYGLAIYQFSSPLALDPPARTGSAVQISWPGAPSMCLQQTLSLLQPDWHNVEATAGASRFQVAPTNSAAFYRLIRVEPE